MKAWFSTAVALSVAWATHPCSADTLLLSHWDTTRNADYAAGDETGYGATTPVPPLTGDTQQFGSRSLDYTGAYHTIYYKAESNIDLAGKGTLELWINPQVVAANSNAYLFSAIANADNRVYLRRRTHGNGTQQRLEAYFEVNNVALSLSTGWDWSDSRGALANGAWHHVALTWDLTRGAGSNQVAIYIDGERGAYSDSAAVGADWAVLPTRLAIGSYDVAAGDRAAAYLDELRVSDSVEYTGASFTVPTAPFVVPEPAAAILLGGGCILLSRRPL